MTELRNLAWSIIGFVLGFAMPRANEPGNANRARHPQFEEIAEAKDSHVQYELIALRRMQEDTKTWQTPVLSLTAQAFLLTIALAPDSRPLARGLAAALSSFTALASMQLMARHRWLEGMDNRWLEEYENAKQGWDVAHLKPKDRHKSLTKRDVEAEPMRMWHVWRGYRWWMLVLLAFFVVGVVVVTIEMGIWFSWWPENPLASGH